MEFLSQVINLFHKGGPVMYLLLLCSFVVVTITIERFLYFRGVHTDAPAFIAKLQPLLERQRLLEAIHLCEQMPAAIAQVAAAGLHTHQRGGNIENTLEGTALLIASRLRAYLNYLSVIVTLAPLFGLLGTVIGMISSFSIFNVQSGQPLAITGGIGEALVATAAGLSVAAMALIAHTYLAHLLDQLITDMEQTGIVIIDLLAPKKTVRRENHEIA